MDPDFLLSDEAFARRIAYGLLRDREAAEDLVQEAWVEILERPPEHAAGLRGYIALVLRRLWSGKRKADAARLAREWLAARGEALEETSMLVARAEVHERTVAAVLALNEPYRTTILLRFFEDLTPAQIAARAGVPLETVRTRMKRGLTLLRARLEREGSDWREQWVLALIGPTSSAGRKPAVAPVLLAAGAAALAVVGFSVWYALALRPREEPGAAVAHASAGDGTSPPALELLPIATVRTAPPDEVPATSIGGARVLRGRVSDSGGHPLSGVHLQLSIERYREAPALSSASSDDQGRFDASLAAWSELGAHQRGLFRLMLEAWSPGHAPLTRFIEPADESSGVELVLEPGRVLSGRVLDADGAPLGGVRALVRLRAGEGPVRTASGLTDLEGWLAIGLEPGEAPIDAELWEQTRGFAYLDLAASTATHGDVELGTCTLRPRLELRGRCIRPDGSPLGNLPLHLVQVQPSAGGGYTRVTGTPAERALGRPQIPLYTDALGRFETRALRPGQYQILGEPGPLQDGAVWDAGGPPIEIVLDRRHLIVKVEGPDGRLLEEARVAAARLPSTARPGGAILRTLTGGEPPAAIIAVEEGEELDVLAFVPGCASVEERVSIASATYETRLRVRLAPESRSATLALRPSAGASDAWSIALCSPSSGLPLPELQDLAPDAGGRVRDLPLGRYRVRCEPRPTRPGAGPDELPENCAAFVDRVVELVSGETPLEFTVLPAARARIQFLEPGEVPARAPSQVATNAAMHVASNAGSDLWSWLGASLPPGRAILEVWAPALDAERPLQRLTGLRPRAGQFLDVLVPAVPLRVRLELDGRLLHEAELEPAAGETVQVPIPLADSAATPKTGATPR